MSTKTIVLEGIEGTSGTWSEVEIEEIEEIEVEDSGYEWSERSKERMKGVHHNLVEVMNLALSRSPLDMTILEGVRTVERQRELVDSGASQTMNSRHLTGHALDVAPLDPNTGEVSWDWPLYYKIEPIIKQAARDIEVPIEWGGDWTSFKDGPHWQLPWKTYPA